MLRPTDVAILPALDDNYIYVLHDGADASVVDPGDAAPVTAFLAERRLRLTAILLTHAHADHTAGTGTLKRATGCRVVGPKDCGFSGLDREVRDGDLVPVPGGSLRAIWTPGHLPAQVSFHEPSHNLLFSGDTLFAAGCGRLMGCAAPVLWQSLCRLRGLPPETQLFCGHEYTQDNLEFAVHLEPQNLAVAKRLADVRATRSRGKPTVPSTLAVERLTNPFLRADEQALQVAVGMAGRPPEEVFAEIRRLKDRW